MTIVSYDVDADNKLKKALRKAEESGLDLSVSMGEAARLTKKENKKNFILKGYGQYPALSEKYAKYKEKKAPGTPILTGLTKTGFASGKLKKSIVETTPDSIIRIGKRSLEVGTKATSETGAPYPVFVQEGTNRMPARKFLFFSQPLVQQIINTVEADISNQLAKI